MAWPVERVMAGRRLRKAQQHWTRLADTMPEMDLIDLRHWRGKAAEMRRELDLVIHAADARLAAPQSVSAEPRRMLGTDWHWRPDLWRAPLPAAGGVADILKLAVSADVTLFHDCAAPEISVRQGRNHARSGLQTGAPMAVTAEVFGFDGSFLSLAMQLPPAATDGLKLRHLIRVDAVIDAERPVSASVRLNVKHGPNVEQLVRDLPRGGRDIAVDFDLAYGNIQENRVERVWLDLIFDRPAMNRITLRDLTVSRRPRAEL